MLLNTPTPWHRFQEKGRLTAGHGINAINIRAVSLLADTVSALRMKEWSLKLSCAVRFWRARKSIDSLDFQPGRRETSTIALPVTRLMTVFAPG